MLKLHNKGYKKENCVIFVGGGIIFPFVKKGPVFPFQKELKKEAVFLSRIQTALITAASKLLRGNLSQLRAFLTFAAGGSLEPGHKNGKK